MPLEKEDSKITYMSLAKNLLTWKLEISSTPESFGNKCAKIMSCYSLLAIHIKELVVQ